MFSPKYYGECFNSQCLLTKKGFIALRDEPFMVILISLSYQRLE